MPRTVNAHLFSSLNGVVESPNLFQFDSFGEADSELMGKALAGITDVVIGRILWQEWSEYWPTNNDDGFGPFINPVRKHVVSTTLTGDLEWNSHVIEGDPVAHVQRLKDSDEEGSISVVGGVETIRSLFVAGVVDALTLTIHPAVTNEGRRLFDDSVPLTRLSLVDSTITPLGNAVLTYSRRAG